MIHWDWNGVLMLLFVNMMIRVKKVILGWHIHSNTLGMSTQLVIVALRELVMALGASCQCGHGNGGGLGLGLVKCTGMGYPTADHAPRCLQVRI